MFTNVVLEISSLSCFVAKCVEPMEDNISQVTQTCFIESRAIKNTIKEFSSRIHYC
jgi:hypothetical protein